jgi:hypothetical protein
MRLRSFLALGVASSVLGGCALPAQDLRRDASLSWIRDDLAPGARLMLGVPDSDDLRVTMFCTPRSGAVDVTIEGRRGDTAVVELHSGKIWNRYRGAGHAVEERGGVDIDLQKLSAADPVLLAFADTGQLMIRFRDRREVLPNAFAPAHDFLAACRLP